MWFVEVTTVEEIKKLYRQLAMQHHPDRGGDTAVMQDINAQYHEALKACSGQESIGTDGKTHRYTYNQTVEQEIIEKIRKLLDLHMVGVEVWLIGYWIWVRGNTKPYAEKLKDQKCYWHSKRLCWYWKPYQGQKTKYSGASFEMLADRYGLRVFEEEENRSIT